MNSERMWARGAVEHRWPFRGEWGRRPRTLGITVFGPIMVVGSTNMPRDLPASDQEEKTLDP